MSSDAPSFHIRLRLRSRREFPCTIPDCRSGRTGQPKKPVDEISSHRRQKPYRNAAQIVQVVAID